MTEKTADSFNIDIHMAGDIAFAGQIIQRLAVGTGLCVTLSPQSFIYTGGREEGFRVGIINYARFPSTPEQLLDRAKTIANALMLELGQHSYSIVTPIESIWISRREETAATKEPA